MARQLLALLILTATSSVCSSASDIDGPWRGMLSINPSTELKLAINLSHGADGNPEATFDSPDQGAYGIPGEVKFLSADSINISISKINAAFAGKLAGDSIRGTFRQGFFAKPMTFHRGSWTPERPQTPKPPYPYITEEVTFTNKADSTTLSGTLTLPQGFSSSTPVAVMVTGSGLQNRDEELFGHKPFAVIADHLAHNGIATLRYDDRGFGKSTGNGTTATTADFAADASEAIGFLKGKSFDKVGVIGHSEGAVVAFMLASGMPDNAAEKSADIIPAFIVTLGAPAVRGDSILADQSGYMLRQGAMPESIVADYNEALLKMYGRFGKSSNAAIAAYVDTICREWPADNPVYAPLKANLKQIAASANPWLRYFVGMSPAKYIATAKCPAFVLYGEKDIQVSPGLNMEAMKALAPKATVKLYPSLNHLFQHAVTGSIQEYAAIEETISPKVLDDIVCYIKSATE